MFLWLQVRQTHMNQGAQEMCLLGTGHHRVNTLQSTYKEDSLPSKTPILLGKHRKETNAYRGLLLK